ncbi:DUF4148 domain-containing protein [Merismopedia glauca]|uniref:Uncharacterized protein n=1 Tax=Merismopedia glauca CCAP 1448/3 TaxID=1296344 RepID=A0A2T1BXG9_9CYAN|nr:DUF4148 domain-containing protein [Merismopedia glauca]PSB00691.1 hypothetical protein C7B64_22190 [Merismopedia glauca CCAP 1448/3]
MNKITTISALAITLMSTAIVSAPASAQNIFTFPASACQPTRSESAARLSFDSNSVRHNGIDTEDGTLVCPINNPTIINKVRAIATVSFPTGATPPLCTLKSFKLDGTLLGTSSTQPISGGKALLTQDSITPGNYHTFFCRLRPGNEMKNYQLVLF